MIENLQSFLDAKVAQYNRPEFIENDPIVIPHLFSKKQDIEIMGFWAATLAWGQRVTIIKKCKELITLMDGAPYDFIINHEEPDLKKLLSFKHRTFNDIDTLYFISFFRYHYENFDSLEDAFMPPNPLKGEPQVANQKAPPLGGWGAEDHLNYFRSYFFSLPDYPSRTKKHVSSPSQKSTCKRLNMFLRWMVRQDNSGVDFGIWNRIKPADLICPLDLHVDRVSRKLLLITRKQTDWQTALELTARLRKFDPLDPVKYDFALFGLGIEERWGVQF
ncbi:TIGR02757 family protein [Mucilaginibacter ginsenosidivorax]|uniref:TIGR02757 family protein n=1 Tax=Mucilaginibacter ginsenosidivorax TaxID=862126 RepID=A0A5B8W8E6_9SPHI|nr:TIGR02757 family protein [Mucilaginibacter ginsenosidivorax]QEC78508.1 TIGR02757 family protein [Mucilaginibacter ginsenosidivorax]